MSDDKKPNVVYVYLPSSDRHIALFTADDLADSSPLDDAPYLIWSHGATYTRSDVVGTKIAERDERIAELEAMVLELVDRLRSAEADMLTEYSGTITEFARMDAEMNEYRRRVTPQTGDEA